MVICCLRTHVAIPFVSRSHRSLRLTSANRSQEQHRGTRHLFRVPYVPECARMSVRDMRVRCKGRKLGPVTRAIGMSRPKEERSSKDWPAKVTHFVRNLQHVYEISQCKTEDLFAHELGISRSVVNKLRNGRRSPTRRHLNCIANYCGVNPDELLLEHDSFRKIMAGKFETIPFMIHALSVIEENIEKCRDLFSIYEGQYNIYTNKSTEGEVVASLLEMQKVTKFGIQFSMVNPYREEGFSYQVFRYRGYAVPIDQFIYFFGEQEGNKYEVLTMIFQMSAAPKSVLLRGMWSGIGVTEGRKFIAAVPALAMRRQRRIDDWKTALGSDIGILPVDKVPALIQKNLRQERVVVI